MAKNKRNMMPLVMLLGFLMVSASLYFGFLRNTGVQEKSCETEPYITLSTYDAVNKGTAVATVTLKHFVNGKDAGTFTSGSSGSKFQVGDKVELLMDKANYISEVSKLGVIVVDACGNNPHVEYLYATDDSSLKVYNEDGNLLTDSATGGATNQSSSSTNLNLKWKISANADQSSGDMLCVFEASNTTVVDDMVLSGATKVDVPEFYTVAGTSAITRAYEFPKLINGDSKEKNLQLVPESSQTIGDVQVLTTCYSKQAFADTDGSYQVGVEDADGTNKYEDDFDYDFYIQT